MHGGREILGSENKKQKVEQDSRVRSVEQKQLTFHILFFATKSTTPRVKQKGGGLSVRRASCVCEKESVFVHEGSGSGEEGGEGDRCGVFV